MAARKKKTQVKQIVIIGAILCIVTGIILLGTGFAVRFFGAQTDIPVQAQPDEFDETYMDLPHRMYGELADIHIRLLFEDAAEELTIEEIAPWLNVVKKKHRYSYTIKDDEIRAYARELGEKYSNYQSMVRFTSHSGEEMSVENKSTGWIFNEEYAAEKLVEYIQHATSVELKLTDRSEESGHWWIRIAGDYRASELAGNCFAEVSIEDQYMWVVKDGSVILESPIVTGNPNTGHDTPKGGYYVYQKKTPCTLYGPGYETEVSYWMAFVDDVGFHDATWQESFGGEVYYSNGSHGCVNLPLYVAEELYQLTYLHMPVYVY